MTRLTDVCALPSSSSGQTSHIHLIINYFTLGCKHGKQLLRKYHKRTLRLFTHKYNLSTHLIQAIFVYETATFYLFDVIVQEEYLWQ
ncbi:unnamed protein product, partial [Brenthis ino]